MSETKNLKLFKHDEPLETNENKFDIDLALNQNWDKIDKFADTVDNKVTNLQEQNTKLEEKIKKDRENMINLETEGQSIHIEDSSDLEGQLEVLGNVEQDVREGYNLYDYMTKVLATANGLTITKDIKNGYLIANGTQKGDYMSICNLTDITDNLKDKTTYTLWQEKYDNKLYLQVVGTKKDDTGNTRFYSASQKTTFTVDKSKYNRYTINIQTGLTTQAGTFSNYKNRYMLYEGTDDKPYEQYGASPTPEYPSEIRTVGDKGSVEIQKTTANYYNVEDYNGNLNSHITIDENNWITASGKNTEESVTYLNHFTNNLDLIVGKKYWIVAEIKSVSGEGNFNITSASKGSGQFNGRAMQLTDLKIGQKVIFQETAINSAGQGLRTFISLQPGQTCNITFRLSVLETEPNKSNWKYVPYKKETYILPIQKSMLEGDSFIKEVDGWKEVHNWGKKVFDGTENWDAYEDTQPNAIGFGYNYQDGQKNFVGLSNYFIPYNMDYMPGRLDKDIEGLVIRYNYIKISRFKREIPNVESLKKWLKEIYDLGKPLYVYYKLEIPTKLPCTPEQTKVLDELDNFSTYKPVTNITTDSIAKLRLKYIADTKTYIDNKTSNLEQQVSVINQLLSTTKTSSVLLDNLQKDIESEVL